jgi:hypothetical protein
MQQTRRKESADAITKRVRNFRARQKFRKLLTANDSFIALDLAAYYRNQNLTADCWISAEAFCQNYNPQHRQWLLTFEFTGVESAVAQIDGRTMRLIRPKGIVIDEQ